MILLLKIVFRFLDIVLLLPLLAITPVTYVLTGNYAYEWWYSFSLEWQDFLNNQ